MPRLVGVTRSLTEYQGKQFDNVYLSVENIPGEDVQQADIMCGNSVRSYKMKTDLFYQCLAACFCKKPDDLMGKKLILSVNRQYATCSLFTVVPE